jgi:hypothetical protein
MQTTTQPLYLFPPLPSPPQGGLRFIYNFTPGRKLEIIKQKQGKTELIASLTDALVIMDGPGAGAGGKGDAHHGRQGDGYSGVLDMARARGGEVRGVGDVRWSASYRAFNSRTPLVFLPRPGNGQTVEGNMQRRAAAAAEALGPTAPVSSGGAAAPAAAVLEPAGGGGGGGSSGAAASCSSGQAATARLEHCFLCGAMGDLKWSFSDRYKPGFPFVRLCRACMIECRSDHPVTLPDSVSVRPAVTAGACAPAGCTGCFPEELPAAAVRARASALKRRRPRKGVLSARPRKKNAGAYTLAMSRLAEVEDTSSSDGSSSPWQQQRWQQRRGCGRRR